MTQLLSFLDEIEDETEKELAESVSCDVAFYNTCSEKCSSVCSFVVHDCQSDMTDVKSEYSTTGVLSSIKEKMVTQKVQLEDYSRTIEVLKKALEQSQKKQKEMKSEHEQEMKAKLTKLRYFTCRNIP